MEYRRNREGPYPFADVTDVVDHIDRVVNLVGIDHVGIGSDYDGVGDTLPSNLKDVSTFPNLISELLTRGYTEEDIEKILSGNIIRVWKEVEDFANGRESLSRDLPLFPLNVNVLPGGYLPLQIFEPRYLDMVKKSMSQEIGFCVHLIKPTRKNEEVSFYKKEPM